MSPIVLITGATGGLGLHVTQHFIQQGWEVLATVLNEDAKSLFLQWERCTAIQCDVTDPDSVEELSEQLPRALSAVVHLVGGIGGVADIDQTNPDDFAMLWQLNTMSTYLLLRATVPILKNNAGAFVAIGARTVLHPEPRKALYAATKAAVVHLVLTAAEEGRPYGMRANVIMPSIIRTPANLEWASDGQERDWVDPEDIARCIYALCSDTGRGITGSVIPMYGKIPF
jgi:NAD(P)-dependent dehydrogenase (short-subunit alcohol dehydrogenase family)